VLHDIDLTIAPRSRVAIVGETGSGKSTLAKLLTRLMDASRGTVRLDGVDLRTIRFSSLRSRVVLVPQEGFLFDGTLAENVAYGLRGDVGEPVLHDIDLTIAPRSRVAIVGETGSGKSTLAKLLTRLMDPTAGRVLLDGTELRRIRFSSLRSRVVLVPQEGFLFDGTLLDNVRFGRPDATEEQVRATLTDLGLDGWVATLPLGLATDVGQRGESLSAGERQLVALARAYLADPDLLVLDEATSAVDPHTEVRLQRALDSLTRGRTSIAIAHRLSTAENADEAIVVDAGRIVERGHHSELVALGGVYTRLHASWVAQQQAL